MFLTELYVFMISPMQQYLWDWRKEITLLDIFRGTGQVTKGRKCKSAQSVTTTTWEDTKQGKTAQPPWNRLFYTKVTNHILFSPMHCYHWKKIPIKHNSSRETEQWYLLYKVSPGISKVVCSKNQEKDKQKNFGLQNNSSGSYSATPRWKMEFYDELLGKKKYIWHKV